MEHRVVLTALRVAQLDSRRLDAALVDLLRRAALAALDHLPVGSVSAWADELTLVIHGVVHVLSVSTYNGTYGQRLLGLEYGVASAPWVRPSPARRALHLLAVVAAPYAWGRRVALPPAKRALRRGARWACAAQPREAWQEARRAQQPLV